MGTFIILAFAGFFVKHALAFGKFHRQTPQVTFLLTLKSYFFLNMGGIIASPIVIAVLCYLVLLDGGQWLIERFTGGNIPSDIPAGVQFFIFISGYMIDSIINIINGIINPIGLKLNNDGQKEIL